MATAWPGYLMEIDGPQNVVTDVQAVQAKLGVQQTGTYGPTTAENVSKFQGSHGIGKTAQVGNQTWDALFNTPVPPAALGAKALSWGKGEGTNGPNSMGVTENPLGSNWGDRVSQYLGAVGITDPASWCAAFVYWCFTQAAKQAGVPNPMIRSGSCSQIYSWARDKGFLVYAPQPGDMFLCIGGDTGHYHTGFVVTAPAGNDKWESLEGNSNLDGSSNGIGVVWRSPGRPVSSCDYVRL